MSRLRPEALLSLAAALLGCRADARGIWEGECHVEEADPPHDLDLRLDVLAQDADGVLGGVIEMDSVGADFDGDIVGQVEARELSFSAQLANDQGFELSWAIDGQCSIDRDRCGGSCTSDPDADGSPAAGQLELVRIARGRGSP
jgi:hypothetical protein